MNRLISNITGRLVSGHQIASGTNPNTPYPAGSVSLQIPFFKQRGLDLTDHHPATLNISVAPKQLMWNHPQFRFEHVAWIDGFSPETFWFSPCEVVFSEIAYRGWVYYPHPDTKTQHFHDASLVEVICEQRIPNIHYDDEIGLRFSAEHFNFE